MFKENVSMRTGNGLVHVNEDCSPRPWLSGVLAPAYDWIMARRVFPNLFGSDQHKHEEILKKAYRHLRGMDVLEIGTGSGNAAGLLSSDNRYVGVDTSPSLLRIAQRRFKRRGYAHARFVVCDARKLPFRSERFDVCLCNLSLNFCEPVEQTIAEVLRVLQPNGQFLVSLPLADRMPTGKTIRGQSVRSQELHDLLKAFQWEELDDGNGAIAYLRAYRRTAPSAPEPASACHRLDSVSD